ncbi:hypothetical protein F5051DRAFT_447626 [Lentinula edodes]|uniref:uncharacterized protein n=1 Tax=Lentinula edodes TaxID=5353 RepID=UPI001E8E7AEB|nr:uncharacterized protein C8R40DRAFT_1174843 [Lentinula edodes]KAH7871144.1 hypothetical protein C8R40DRAFT_1174843 [Lentinula edodes]KAJ3870489.1 hypothetical protein F5051DRAFT_447626 [Lentinula edodes]KAJ3885707.1 hypothetical protein GG344DRAFT_82443 [Lentinula edodes]
MGMNHIATCIPNRHTRIKGIRARLYPANSVSPKAIKAQFREDARQPSIDRFVFAGDLLSEPRIQPYIHDIALTVRYCGKSFTFLVFFKRHKLLPPNQSIQNLQGGHMRGDVLVVACGKRVPIRNLRSGLEDRAADRAIKRLTEALNPIETRRRFPSTISFT